MRREYPVLKLFEHKIRSTLSCVWDFGDRPNKPIASTTSTWHQKHLASNVLNYIRILRYPKLLLFCTTPHTRNTPPFFDLSQTNANR